MYSGAVNDLHLQHPGFKGGGLNIYPGDVEQLAQDGLIRLDPSSMPWKIQVAQLGREYAAWKKAREGQSALRVTEVMRKHVDLAAFSARHAAATAKWRDAEARLWVTEAESETTIIGHLCREAQQEFAASLLKLHGVTAAEPDRAKVNVRVGAVLAKQAGKSKAVEAYAIALGNYWEAVTGLIQRQEHGAAKEGEPLTWEDSRRLVFATLFAMTELDRLR